MKNDIFSQPKNIVELASGILDKSEKDNEEKFLEESAVIQKKLTNVDLQEKEGPCWNGYEMVGMKKKDGKEVPNCVPKKEEEMDPIHKKILDKEKNKVAKQPKGEYERKVSAHLKKKYQKQEEMHPNQKKLDKNKNGKLDSDDFKKLRGEEKSSIIEKYKRLVTKDDVIKLLVKYGNNPDTAKKMVNKEFDSAAKTYPDATARKIADVIRTIYEDAEQLDELSPSTLHSYKAQATGQAQAHHTVATNSNSADKVSKHSRLSHKRMVGVSKAQQKLAQQKREREREKSRREQQKKIQQKDESLEEGKSSTGYELYHKDFSTAMQHAYDFAKKNYGIEVDPKEIDDKVASGPRKPSSGKTNSYRLKSVDGKKAIQVQVYNMDNKKYELNMYKEDLDVENLIESSDKQDAKEMSDLVKELYPKISQDKLKKEVYDIAMEKYKNRTRAQKIVSYI